MPTTEFDLERVVTAQAPHYEAARRELIAGRKLTHWMWFMFPQLVGLGHSRNAVDFGIGSLAEARAYLADPVLGPRLIELTGIVARHAGRAAHDIFGSPDDLKFRSSMTLFSRAAPDNAVFGQAIGLFFGSPDPRTLALLEGLPNGGNG
jgi:uncharacterized protein (DUF1810 family)